MTANIAVIGSTNVDLIMKMPRLPQRGETVTDAQFVQTFGGKGANQAVAAARAGGRVDFVGCVGDDRYGTAIVENLQADGVGVEFVFTAQGVASGIALVMIGEGGDNYLSVAPGANYRLTQAHIEQARGVIDRAALVLLQCEITPDALDRVIEIAAAQQRPVMLNLAPARPLAEASLRRLGCLVLNESEASFLCGFTVDSPASAAEAAKQLHQRGPQVVLITLGVQGVQGVVGVAAGGTPLQAPAFDVKAVDTTAAGDVFCGVLAAALVERQPLPEALRLASAAAALSVTRLGAQPSIPTRAETEAFLRRQA